MAKFCNKTICLLIISMGCLFSCSSSENFLNKNEMDKRRDTFLGEWKLIEMRFPMINLSVDYSKYNTIFDFRDNGILRVSGVPADIIDKYPHESNGEYVYSLNISPVGSVSGMIGWVPIGLQIFNMNNWFDISSNKMEINGSHLDGAIYYLIKIKAI